MFCVGCGEGWADPVSAYDDLRAGVEALADHYASMVVASTAYPPAVAERVRNLLAPAPASETASRCDLRAGVDALAAVTRDDRMRDALHALLAASGAEAAREEWECTNKTHRPPIGCCRPAPTPPTTVQADDEQAAPTDRMVPVSSLWRSTELLAEREAEVADLRSAVNWWAAKWTEARQVLAYVADRIDEFTYDEFAGLFDDEPVDRMGETYTTTVQADRDAGQVRLTFEERMKVRGFTYNIGAADSLVAVVERILAARQSNPDATERDRQWAQRFLKEWARPYFGPDSSDAIAAVLRAQAKADGSQD